MEISFYCSFSQGSEAHSLCVVLNVQTFSLSFAGLSPYFLFFSVFFFLYTPNL